MKVILDANIIISDFNMQTPSFKITLESAKRGEIELHIPEIVLDEVFNKFAQRLQKTKSEISSEIEKFNKLTRKSVGSPFTDPLITKSIKEYQDHVQKIIKEHHIVVDQYPATDHKRLAKKAMLSKKPFNINEKGYRDCLIWENLKSLISQEDVEIASTPEAVFISGNHKDFCAKENKLHEDLIEELEEDKLRTDSIIIYSNLTDFNDKVTKLFFEKASQFEGKLRNKDFWDFELKDAIDKYLFKEFVGQEWSLWEYSPGANSRPTISAIYDDYQIDDISVKKLSSDEYIVDVQFKLNTELDYYVDKHEHYSAEDQEYSVIDYDWNDHVVHVSNTATIPMYVTLIIASDLNIESIEINNIDNYDEY